MSDTGLGGRYNFPNSRLKRLEEDDSKRAIIGKSLHNILTVSKAFDAPPKSDEELCERLNWFFQTCAETNQIPTVEKMCLSLGWSRKHVFFLISGEARGFTTMTGNILQKAKDLISSLDAELALDSKIQPVVYMFRAKNYYGMRDTQDVEISARPLVDQPDREALEAKYAELPDD